MYSNPFRSSIRNFWLNRRYRRNAYTLIIVVFVVFILVMQSRPPSSEEINTGATRIDNKVDPKSEKDRIISKQDASTDSRLENKVKFPSARTAILIMKSIVDIDRHILRARSISVTWGDSYFMGENNMELFVITCEQDELKAKYNRLCPPTELGKSKTRHLLWAMEQLISKYPPYRVFVKADDITYFFPSNLNSLIDKLEAELDAMTTVAYTGNVLRLPPKGMKFVSGGAGIIMTHAMARKCVLNPPKGHDQNEDLALAKCALPVEPIPAIAKDDGTELLNVFGPVRTSLGEVDSWYTDYKTAANIPSSKIEFHRQTVGFHYVDHELMRFIDKLMMSRRRWEPLQVVREFPKSGVGGYERKIENEKDAQRLLDNFNKIVLTN